MASGSETRQRPVKLTVRFNAAEARAVRARAERAGVSMASLLRISVLEADALPAARRPSLRHEDAARMLGELGEVATALNNLIDIGAVSLEAPRTIEALRTLAELRVACILDLGRDP